MKTGEPPPVRVSQSTDAAEVLEHLRELGHGRRAEWLVERPSTTMVGRGWLPWMGEVGVHLDAVDASTIAESPGLGPKEGVPYTFVDEVWALVAVVIDGARRRWGQAPAKPASR